MARVILRFKNRSIGEFPVSQTKPLTIGRRNENDIVIDNLAVSGDHAKIFHHPKGYVISDLNSKNGTFVKQKRVKNYLLKHKDIITIGKHHLIFDNVGEAKSDSEDQSPEAIVPDGLAADQTMFMDTEQYRKMVGRSGSKNNGNKGAAHILFHSGGEGRMVLSKAVTTIGKNSESDIKLRGFASIFAGRTAATISKTSDNYEIRHIGGFIKPKLNGLSVKDSVKLNEKDMIEIGPVRFSFFLSDPTSS